MKATVVPKLTYIGFTVSLWHTDELHVAKLLAVKRTVATGKNWPEPDRHKLPIFAIFWV